MHNIEPVCLHCTELADMAVTVKMHTREVLGSNLGRDTGYPD
jgi:hypothetical protein